MIALSWHISIYSALLLPVHVASTGPHPLLERRATLQHDDQDER